MYLRFLIALMAAITASQAALLSVTGTGADATALSPTVSAFEAALGGANNGAAACSPTPCTNGFRVINWDAVPNALAAPNNFPGNFFNGTRGALFQTPGTGFQVSANAGVAPVRFANINATYSSTFTTFSPERLFTSFGSNIIDVFFSVPGIPGVSATTSGFGAVFTDVDLANTTSLQFFSPANTLLGTVFAPPLDNGLSFAGGVFNAGERVARVRITSGNAALGPNDSNGNPTDVVVMDDFIYGEPLAAVPEPSTFFISAPGLIGLAAIRRFRKARALSLD